MILQPAKAGGRLLNTDCRPFHGFDGFLRITQGSASLHPGLYASACCAGSLNVSARHNFLVATAGSGLILSSPENSTIMFKNKRALNPVTLVLLFSLVQSVIPATSAQQQPSRERRVAPGLVASPTSSPTPIASPVASPVPSPQASPTPKVATTTQTVW